MEPHDPASDAVEDAAPSAEPRMFRTMEFDTDGTGRRMPKVGTLRNMLGARVPPSAVVDVRPDGNGNVAHASGGLSVAPGLDALTLGLVPERLRDRRPGARGSNASRLFRLGEAPFTRLPVGEGLELEPTSAAHGVVRPSRTMAVQTFQSLLASTRDRWIDEG